MKSSSIATSQLSSSPQLAIVWFDQLTKSDAPTAGGKGANLGVRAQPLFTPGFVISAGSFLHAMEVGGAHDNHAALRCTQSG